MKKKIIYVLFASLLVIVLESSLSPLFKSEAKMRKDLLKLTPIGTPMSEVLKVIEKHKKWKLDWISEDSGYGISQDGSPGGIYSRVGEKSIRVHLAEFHIIVWIDIDVFYGFDKDGKLIEIAVWKVADSL